MLFDLGVKKRKADFFNYEEEYIKLKDGLRNEKLIAITGLRRVGKSSMLSILYNETNAPKIWVDGRKAKDEKEFLAEMEELAAQVSISYKAIHALSSVDVGPFSFSLNPKPSLEEIDKYIKDRAYIFVDEVQRIKGIADVLSLIYDFSEKICVIAAGSEIGLVEDILGRNGGALAGRLHLRVHLPPLSEESAEEFLRKGFDEAGKRVESYEIRDAVEKLGTLAGWLTYYGNMRLRATHSEALKRVIDDGKVITREELRHFLKRRKNKEGYVKILRMLRNDALEWSEIYRRVGMGKSRVSEALKTLEEYGFVVREENKYKLADRMLSYALSSGKL